MENEEKPEKCQNLFSILGCLFEILGKIKEFCVNCWIY